MPDGVVDLHVEHHLAEFDGGGAAISLNAIVLAALVYRRRLHWIDVFVWPADGITAPANFERNGFREVSWAKDSFRFTAVSDLNSGELTSFADLLKSR